MQTNQGLAYVPRVRRLVPNRRNQLVDPNFASNRYVYVYYTTSTSPIHNRVSRFTASVANKSGGGAGHK